MKKLILAVFIVGLICVSAKPAWAPLVNTFDDSSSSSSGSGDTSTVDLSQSNTDQTTWSPSFDNQTPAGQAAGGPVDSQ